MNRFFSHLLSAVAGRAAPLTVISLVAFSGMQAAAAPSADEVDAWISSQWDDATKLKDLAGTRWTFRVEFPFVPPASEIDSIRERVRGHPDHPERQNLSTYERRLKLGPDVTNRQIWYLTNQMWRISSTQTTGDAIWTDIANNGRSAWALTANQLNVISSSSPEPSHDYTENAADVVDTIRQFAFASFGDYEGFARTRSRATVTGDDWTFDASSSISTIRFHGRWDSTRRRGLVSRATLVEFSADPSRVGEYSDFQDWAQRGSYFAATRVSSYSAKSAILQSLVLTDISPAAEPEIVLLCQPPTLDTDPIRGKVTYTSLNDFREGSEQQYSRAPDGRLRREGESPAFDADRRLLITGWVILGSLVVLFLGLLVRRVRKQTV